MKENQDISSFDSWVKSSLEHANVNPPSGLWQGIESGIGTSSAGSAGLIDQIHKLTQQLGWKAVVGVAGMAVVGGFLFYSMVSRSPEEKTSNTEKADQVEQLEDAQKVIHQSETIDKEGQNSSSETPISQNDTYEPESSHERADAPMSSYPAESLGGSLQASDTEVFPSAVDHASPDKSKPMAQHENADQPFTFEIKATTVAYCDRMGIDVYLEPPVQATWYFNGKTSPFVIANDLALEIVWDKDEGLDEVSSLTAEYQGVKKTIEFKRERLSDFSWENTGGDHVQFSVQGQQPEMMWWDYGDGSDVEMSSESMISHYFNYKQEPYQVMMIARYDDGCIDTIKHQVSPPKTDIQYEPFIPNVFTPYSKDGKNDVFKVEIDETTYYHLVIQNPQGVVVFESRDPAEAWNGKYNNRGEMCGKGKYIYTLRYAVKEQRVQVRQDILTIR